MNNLKLDNRGMAVLLIVIIISVSALIIALSASMLGIGEMDMGYTAQKGQQARALADGCVEEALRQLQMNVNWTGSTLDLLEGSCIMDVAINGSNHILNVAAVTGNFTKKMQIVATVNNGVVKVSSWQEQEN